MGPKHVVSASHETVVLFLDGTALRTSSQVLQNNFFYFTRIYVKTLRCRDAKKQLMIFSMWTEPRYFHFGTVRI